MNIDNRYDPAKNYDRHLFMQDRILQAAELNELQDALIARTAGIANALFADGGVIRDAQCIVRDGFADLESGAIYMAGAVRGVPPATLPLSMVGTETIGVYLQESTVTEIEDPELLNPAVGTRGYMEPGAHRLRIDPVWGVAGDGQEGTFYPVYTVIDGVLQAKEPPPNIDAVTQSIARYDRDSAGGSYVVSGLNLHAQGTLPSGEQVYNLSEGRARVMGYGVEITTSRRLVHLAAPDYRDISGEPHPSTTVGAQRLELNRTPVGSISEIRIQRSTTETISHGGYSGAQDPLPDTAVVSITAVEQGDVVFEKGVDYKLTGDKVDWSLQGAEPAPGSTYTVTYEYMDIVAPDASDAAGCTVSGAVPGSTIFVSYRQMLPRIDRLAMSKDGALVWIKGVSADWNPMPPAVPGNLLPIAAVHQRWTDETYVVNNSVRMVPMSYLSALNDRMDAIIGLVAQQRLESDIHMREAGAKRGLFVDPFRDDSMRDAGIPQTAAVINGELTLSIINSGAEYVSDDITKPATLPYTPVVVLAQSARTGEMKVNPYQAFAPIPARITLKPAVDRWTLTEDVFGEPVTKRFTTGTGDMSKVTEATKTVLTSTVTVPIESIRPIVVQFDLEGFYPGEILHSVFFDGVTVDVTE